MNRRTIWLIIMLFILGFNSSAEEASLSLTVKVTGVEEDQGQIFLSLFTSESNYLKQPVISRNFPVENNDEMKLEMNGLGEGIYAVSVFYDQDGDGKMKKGFMGIPKEPVGFSNNVKGTFGPPSFEETSFQLETDMEIVIHLGKARD